MQTRPGADKHICLGALAASNAEAFEQFVKMCFLTLLRKWKSLDPEIGKSHHSRSGAARSSVL